MCMTLYVNKVKKGVYKVYILNNILTIIFLLAPNSLFTNIANLGYCNL